MTDNNPTGRDHTDPTHPDPAHADPAHPDHDHTARDLRIAVGRLARRIRQIYATVDDASGITFTELTVLSRLERQGPSTSAALASSEQVTPQAIGTALGALAQRGLVSRAPDPADGRRVVTRITEAGRHVLGDRTHAVTEQIGRAVGDTMDAEERRRLARALPLLERLADRL
ncbi:MULTISPECIES: MarR family winged helix-turn-helix transcriptional regulator [Streptosporangium]|uniref:DNA-binding MarR family transcriptional regulator n=1 Tax=Streptosporangium brasiliense TaxID=47480 RepID=A0ABT9QYG5_9ACTN|nr:MarR family transcriptional regulator [Streptosporangium brasiliense]MDP9862032.1 DNA-binding MarR family transcriptional regulator [Streptosporangium brasiliense]